jgi:hypothetical protein
MFEQERHPSGATIGESNAEVEKRIGDDAEPASTPDNLIGIVLEFPFVDKTLQVTTWTRSVPPIGWATRTPPTSVGNTKASSAFHRYVICNTCGKRHSLKLPDEKDGPIRYFIESVFIAIPTHYFFSK